MKIKIKPKYLIHAILVWWFIFSVGYIACDQWNSFKEGALQGAYYAGREDCVNNIIEEVKKANCNSISISNDTDKVDMINVQCLSGGENNE